MLNNRNKTDYKQKMGAFMNRFSRLLLIIILFSPAIGGQQLMAEYLKSEKSDSLIIKQFSIDKNTQFTNTLDGQLTFRILLDNEGDVDAAQLMTWLEEGAVVVDGIRLHLEQAVVKSSRNLVVPFEFEEPLSGEYLETTIRISGTARYDAAKADLSLYRGVNGMVGITSSGSRFRTNRQAVVPEGFRFEGHHARPELLAYAVLPAGEELHEQRSSFLFRNRYWLVGAAALAVSSTTAMILNTGDSVTYLPEPPGRP